MLSRPSPIGKPVSLFVTCIVDMIYPQTGVSVVKVLRHYGVSVDFPMGQTCCGQPAFNSGYRSEAKQVAKQLISAFENSQVIVSPSGSCVAMIRHEYPALFEDDAEWKAKADKIASITWEFTEFLVEGLGITDFNGKLPEPESFAFHDACHGLRLLGLGVVSRQLLDGVDNAEVHPLKDCDMCCGFGGLFSVKMPAVSDAMLQEKIKNINACEADTIITGDSSCLTQMNGGLSRHKSPKKVRHIADILADSLQKDEV
jgi:L-lactate dehydrogenase complex protein LldE